MKFYYIGGKRARPGIALEIIAKNRFFNKWNYAHCTNNIGHFKKPTVFRKANTAISLLAAFISVADFLLSSASYVAIVRFLKVLNQALQT